ncbi:hypothetical protein JKF63_05181 [Porcisia hertigi]|uniref:Peroxisomal membrane protein PEX14 n=1 Tax=Porcisia hertigi TaxID=2761500 RepID=A0A836IJI9_9TRYP|nr:hypothetical protein JKF63_05181 [Porcisia hertigi]
MSNTAAAVLEPSQVALPGPLPEPEQASASEMDDNVRVQSAIRFLQDPRVRHSAIESQIRFLKGKGVSDPQIKYAFAKVGRTVTAETIASVRVPPANTVLPAAAATARATPLSAQLKTARQSMPVAMTPGPQYTQTLFPHSPIAPQEEPQAKTLDWRDVVIGVGAAVLTGFTGYKLFNRYSSYELRRKPEKRPRLYQTSHSRHRSANNVSSESETDASSTRHRGRAPPLPPPPTVATAGVPIASVIPPSDFAEKINKLQMELDETKEALANERKKCADLAVSAAKIRADKQQLSRTNDRLSQQIDGLKKDIEKLNEEKSATVVGDSALSTKEEEAETPAPTSVFLPSVAPAASGSALAGDDDSVLPAVPSPEVPAVVTPSPAISAAVKAVDPAEPMPVAKAPLVPEPTPAAVAEPVLSAESTVPAGNVAGVLTPLIPTNNAEVSNAVDATPVSRG